MKPADKDLRVLDGFTNSKELWLELALHPRASVYPKAVAFKLTKRDLELALKRLDKEETKPPQRMRFT